MIEYAALTDGQTANTIDADGDTLDEQVAAAAEAGWVETDRVTVFGETVAKLEREVPDE